MLLLSCSASRLLPSLSLPVLPTDCHASDAALFVRGFSILLPPEGRGDLGTGFLPPLSPDLKVCSIVLPFSGLGLLLVFFIGGTSVADEEGVAFLEDEDAYGGGYEGVFDVTLAPTTALSELFFVTIAGR
jgi:hypothetical protein